MKDQRYRIIKALSGLTRFKIVDLLLREPLPVKHIAKATKTSHTATSHQLALLRKANIVQAKPQGKEVIYSIANSKVAEYMA